MGSDGGAAPDVAGPHPRGPEELPHTFPVLHGRGYADPPKQQGGPGGAQAPSEAKRNREETSLRPARGVGDG